MQEMLQGLYRLERAQIEGDTFPYPPPNYLKNLSSVLSQTELFVSERGVKPKTAF